MNDRLLQRAGQVGIVKPPWASYSSSMKKCRPSFFVSYLANVLLGSHLLRFAR